MTALARNPALPVEENSVSRKLRAAVAQLGPIHLADSREAVVKRLIALLREAHGTGARFVVLPALLDDRPGRDRPLFRARDAGPGNAAAIRSGEGARHRLLPGLCRADPG